tara:strand:- start:677 stop:1138 length:462 start_codon:yes stop_codon:yes gene_type:complete
MAITITKPTVGGSQDTWGQTINDALDVIVQGVNGTGTGTTAPNLEQGAFKISGTAVTVSAAELNVLDGIAPTLESSELDLLDGSVANTVVNGKAVIYGSAGEVQATTVDLGDWTITETGGSLYFAAGGTNKMKLDASGNAIFTGDVTAFGTIT